MMNKICVFIHLQQCVIVSGAAVTAVTPDKNDMAEFYVSTEIAVPAKFKTDFYCEVGDDGNSGGGIKSMY